MDTSLFYRILEGTVTEVVMRDVATIRSFAFNSCNNLTTAEFPACTGIQTSAFHGCTALTTVSFPVCTFIGSSALYYCTALTTAYFPTCVRIGNNAFQGCYALMTASFPACTTIGSGAFSNCSYLTTASFPACTTIEALAFSGCYHLMNLYLTGSSVCTLGNSNAFTSTPIGGYATFTIKYGSIFVPASLLTEYQAATNWTYFSKRFVGLTDAEIAALDAE